MLKSIAIDWLQFKCSFSNSDIWYNKTLYTLKKVDRTTRHFREIYYMFSGTDMIATICKNPVHTWEAENILLIKIENRYLYQKKLMEFVVQLISDNQWQFKKVVRLDIAMDFNRFANNWHPATLIKKLLSGQIQKIGKSSGTVWFELRDKISFHALRIGTHASEISFILYNKTKELREKKLKPHIVEQWYAIGLDISQDVWRLELTWQVSKKVLKMEGSGTDISLNTIEVIDWNNLYHIYINFMTKYFSFVPRSKDSNKARRKRIELIDTGYWKGVIGELSGTPDSGRMDKIFIRQLNDLIFELSGTADDLAEMTKDVESYFKHSRKMDILVPQNKEDS